jgi:hypothetical protein
MRGEIVDSSKFDLITRKISENASRRSIMRNIGVGGAATALGVFGANAISGGINVADAKKKKKKKKCKVNKCPKPENPCEKAVCKKDKCKKQNQPDGTSCGDDLVCEGGVCVCPEGEFFCEGECIPDGDPCFKAVTNNNLQDWLLEGEDDFSQDPSLTQIVDGPDDPPAPGGGSVKLNPTAFNGFAEEETQAVVRTLQYEGIAVGDIFRLQYSIFVPSDAGDPPTMQLAVNGAPGSFNSEGFASLVFIPGANGNVAPDENDWSDYTPSVEGVWVSTRDLVGPADECLMCRTIGNAHEGSCTDVDICNANKTKTWAQIQEAIPAAELNDSGSFSFRIGRGDTGEGNVTNIVFNNDGYFFEA